MQLTAFDYNYFILTDTPYPECSGGPSWTVVDLRQSLLGSSQGGLHSAAGVTLLTGAVSVPPHTDLTGQGRAAQGRAGQVREGTKIRQGFTMHDWWLSPPWPSGLKRWNQTLVPVARARFEPRCGRPHFAPTHSGVRVCGRNRTEAREREWAEGTVSSLPGTLNVRIKFCHSTGIAPSGGGVRASTTSYA